MVKIKEETKIKGTDYTLEKGDKVYYKDPRKSEAYKGHRMKTSDVDDAFEELIDLLGAETVAQELLNWMSSSEQADALTSIYVDYDLMDDTEYID